MRLAGAILAMVLAGMVPVPARADDGAPTPAGPYPAAAAGWGPTAGGGRFVSRWAEDWSGPRAAGQAPDFKAMPLGDGASLTLSGETRLRLDTVANARLLRGDDGQQGLWRGVLGADLRLPYDLRLYGEVAAGEVEGRDRDAAANFRNAAALQQLFLEARVSGDGLMVGAMVGRQEFADGPRQLLSVSDGPNLHRTWNGVRLYAHGRSARFGAFDLAATRLSSGAFDETVNGDERLSGVNASLVVSRGQGGQTVYLDPFWIHGRKPVPGAGGPPGRDERDTYGARLWGRRGRLGFDWTLARQTGRLDHRAVDAWGLFTIQSLALSGAGWRPRLTAHVDLASGGDVEGPVGTFSPPYASSSYLGEGQFLGLSNLLIVAPGLTLSPTARSSLSVEYGLARRLRTDDAVYAGGGRAYAGTRGAAGREIGGLFRLAGSWSVDERLTLFFDLERLGAGEALRRAGRSSGGYGHIGMTWRY